jgi:hypothetical protein
MSRAGEVPAEEFVSFVAHIYYRTTMMGGDKKEDLYATRMTATA